MFTSRTRAGFAACATLAALGLAAAPAAHAQGLYLNSGDAVTLDSTGTHGTINKAAVSNGTTTYSTTGTTAVQTNGTAAFTLGTGGSLSTVSGYGLYASGSGPVTITGGSITTGTGGDGLFASGSSAILITGGTFTASGAYGGGLYAAGSSTVTITGGTFTAKTSVGLISGGTSSSIDLYGMFDGLTLGQTQTLAGGSGTFTGTLQNNTAPQTISYYNSATIRLHNTAPAAAPEPSQFAAFAVGLLGLGALAVKAKRRVA